MCTSCVHFVNTVCRAAIHLSMDNFKYRLLHGSKLRPAAFNLCLRPRVYRDNENCQQDLQCCVYFFKTEGSEPKPAPIPDDRIRYIRISDPDISGVD
jgi:hypothetical protein